MESDKSNNQINWLCCSGKFKNSHSPFFFFLIFFWYKMSPVLLATHLLATDCINEICLSSFSWVLKFRDLLHVQHHCYHCSYPHCRGTNRPHCHLSCQEEGQTKVRNFGIWSFLFLHEFILEECACLGSSRIIVWLGMSACLLAGMCLNQHICVNCVH